MKAYRVQSTHQIEPFGEHPRECLIVNKRLATLQEEALHSLDMELETVLDSSQVSDAQEHIIFDDRLYFTPELIEEFLVRSRRLGTCTTCALKPGITTLRLVVATQNVQIYPNRVEYGLHYVPVEKFRGKNQAVVIEPDQFFEGLPMPQHMFGSDEYRIPLTEKLIVRIDHWTNLWAANIVTLLAEGARLKKSSKIRLLGLALKARSFNQWNVLRTLNRIGCGCDIHPTAYLEGTTLGDNVRIGAGTVIRHSVVDDSTFIANNVTVDLSVIGQGCNIRNGAVIQYSVLYPGTFTMARLISCSLCGRDTFVGDGAVLTDFRFDGRNMTVVKDGARVDTENTFLGSCLGHGVYLGSGCILAPGRTVPNGYRIVPMERRVIGTPRFDRDIPGYQVIKKNQQYQLNSPS